VRVVQEALGSNACKYRGFVLDGFPRTAEEAKMLFLEPPEEVGEGEEESPDVNKEQKLLPTAPLLAVVLEPPEEEQHLNLVREIPEDVRVENHTDEAGFSARLQRFTSQPQAVEFYTERLPAENILRIAKYFTDEQEIFQAASEALKAKPLPFNYIAPLALATADVTEPEVLIEPSVDEAALAAARREEEERARERALIEKERELLIKQSVELRAYLGEHVVPVVIEALMEICHLQPSDPIDYLAEYLYHAVSAKEELGKIPAHWSTMDWGPPPDSELEY
jgi:adenylate kinase